MLEGSIVLSRMLAPRVGYLSIHPPLLHRSAMNFCHITSFFRCFICSLPSLLCSFSQYDCPVSDCFNHYKLPNVIYSNELLYSSSLVREFLHLYYSCSKYSRTLTFHKIQVFHFKEILSYDWTADLH